MSAPVIPPVVVIDAKISPSKDHGKYKPFVTMELTTVTKTSQALRDNETKLFAESIFDSSSPYTLEVDQSRLLLDTITISYGPVYKIPSTYKSGDYVFLPSLRGRLILNGKSDPKVSNLKLQIFPEQQITIENVGSSTVFISKHLFTPTQKRDEDAEKVDLPHKTDVVGTIRLSANSSHTI